MANTPTYGWETPDDTDYVYQGAAASRTTANAIDASVRSLAQKWVSWTLDSSTVIVASTTDTTMFSGGTFTPEAGRLYLVTYTIGNIQKTTNAGTIFIYLRKNVGGSILDRSYITNMAAFEERPYSKTFVLTSTQMGTTSFTPSISIQASTNGYYASNASPDNGTITIVDIGSI
jgi:hypothetical protein